MSELKHLSRRVKAYPHVPTDYREAVKEWRHLDEKKLTRSFWAFICTIGCALLGALVILILEISA